MVKSNTIRFRVTDEEKAEISAEATKQGHNTEGNFLLWLYRRFKRGQKLMKLHEKIGTTIDKGVEE